jgi:hypothetical protein
MKVKIDPSYNIHPEDSNKLIESFNSALGTAKALDPTSVKAFENTAGKKGVVIYSPSQNPTLDSEDNETTYIPDHILDSNNDQERKALVQHLRAQAVRHILNESEDKTLLNNQLQAIKTNPYIQKSVLSQLANMGVIAGHTPNSISKIQSPKDINMLYKKITTEQATANTMSQYINRVAAKQLADRIRMFPGTDIQSIIRNTPIHSEDRDTLDKVYQMLDKAAQQLEKPKINSSREPTL